MKLQTTLNKIKAAEPEDSFWGAILCYLGKIEPNNDPIDLRTILDRVGFGFALWCLPVCGVEKVDLVRLSLLFARRVKHLATEKSKQCFFDIEVWCDGKWHYDDLEKFAVKAEIEYKSAWSMVRAIDSLCAQSHGYDAYKKSHIPMGAVQAIYSANRAIFFAASGDAYHTAMWAVSAVECAESWWDEERWSKLGAEARRNESMSQREVLNEWLYRRFGDE